MKGRMVTLNFVLNFQPENVIPTPLEPTNPLVKEFLADTWSQDHVPVTCSGKVSYAEIYFII